MGEVGTSPTDCRGVDNGCHLVEMVFKNPKNKSDISQEVIADYCKQHTCRRESRFCHGGPAARSTS